MPPSGCPDSVPGQLWSITWAPGPSVCLGTTGGRVWRGGRRRDLGRCPLRIYSPSCSPTGPGSRRGKEKERNSDWLPLSCSQLRTWPVTQACALTGNQTGNLSVCRPVLSPLSTPARAALIFSLACPWAPGGSSGFGLILSPSQPTHKPPHL